MNEFSKVESVILRYHITFNITKLNVQRNNIFASIGLASQSPSNLIYYAKKYSNYLSIGSCKSLFVLFDKTSQPETLTINGLANLGLRLIGNTNQFEVYLNVRQFNQTHLYSFGDDRDRSQQLFVLPASLISLERFDLAFKIQYGATRKINPNSRWIIQEYIKHIFWITGGHKIIKEYGNTPPKIGINNFISTFNKLLDCESQILEPVRLDKNGILQNGAHRVAAGIANNLKVPIEVQEVSRNVNAGYSFFKQFHFWKRLNSRSLSNSALTLVEHGLDLQMLIIFPNSCKKRELNSQIVKNLRVIYSGQYSVIGDQKLAITKILYGSVIPKGNDSISKYNNLIRDRFRKPERMHVYLIKPRSSNEVLLFKHYLRDTFNLYNITIHTTDSYIENLSLAQAIFHYKSRKIRRVSLAIHNEAPIEDLKCAILESGQPGEFCVVGSLVLSRLGIRPSRDIDIIISKSLTDVVVRKNLKVDVANSSFKKHGFDVEELITNPRYFMYIEGVKYLTLGKLFEFKLRRRSRKDILDILLIVRYQFFCFLLIIKHYSNVPIYTSLKFRRFILQKISS